MRNVRTIVYGALLLVPALVLDLITLASGHYRGVLIGALLFCAATVIVATVGLTQTRCWRRRAVLLMLLAGAAVIAADAIRRLS